MIINFIKKNFWRFIIFCFVGASSALVHIFFFNIFRFWLGVSFILALFFGIFLSIIYNFSMNRNITFSARGHPIKKQIIRFLIVYLIAISINLITALTLKNILGVGVLQENLAAIGGIAMSIPFSFLGSLLWAFKKEDIIQIYK